MNHPERLTDYLAHIHEAIDRACAYLQDCASLEAFRLDAKSQDAVLRNMTIIGEATSQMQHVAPDFLLTHAAIPWRAMRTMRNRVIHNYFGVNLETVWNTVKTDRPPLKAQIAALLAQQAEPPRAPDEGPSR